MERNLDFRQIADQAGLPAREAEHFVDGMESGAEKLILPRETYTLLQALVERAVLAAIPLDEQPEKRPFAYATPKPLTPLYAPHPRSHNVKNMFRRQLGVSVMNEAALQATVQENMRAAREVSLTAGRALWAGADLFSVTSEEIDPPHMAMHFEHGGNFSRVAFVAEQRPSENEGHLVFGWEATEMYDRVLRMHAENCAAGRGSEYVTRLITGRDL